MDANFWLVLFTILANLSLRTAFWEQNDEPNDRPQQLSLEAERLYDEGRQRYELLVRERNKYGACWLTAVDSLRTACKQLDDETHSRLALAFANCFLGRAGLDTYPCEPSVSVADCLKHMSDRAFGAYTEFFTHTQSVCFFLANQLWQRNTEQLVNRLTDTSVEVSDRLVDASESLRDLQSLQRQSIDEQSALNQELVDSRRAVDQFKAATDEQRFVVREILDRFIRLQDFVLIEVSYVYSVLFFVVSMIVAYLLTTTRRTSDARLWLFVIIITNLFVEQFIAIYLADTSVSFTMRYASDAIHSKILISRYATYLLAILVLLWFALTYKNYEYINNQILTQNTAALNEIRQQITEYLCQRGNPGTQLAIKHETESAESDSDFTVDSDGSTSGFDDDSDGSFASIETCSTIPFVSSSTAHNSRLIANNYENESFKLVADKKSDDCEQIEKDLSITDSSETNRYNLRPRKSNPCYLSKDPESADDFAAKVKLSEKLSQINRSRLRSALIHNYSHFPDN